MKRITGLTVAQVYELAGYIGRNVAVKGLPPMMAVREEVVITLVYLRTNRTQDDLAVTYGVSQSTISRTITAMTAAIATALEASTPTLDEVRPGAGM